MDLSVSTTIDKPAEQAETLPAAPARQKELAQQDCDWRNILWREWRNTDDKEYANKLLDYLGHSPTGFPSFFIGIFSGMLYGSVTSLVGTLIGLCLAIGHADVSNHTLLTIAAKLLLVGTVAGGVTGLLFRLCIGGRTSQWRNLLGSITSSIESCNSNIEDFWALVRGVTGFSLLMVFPFVMLTLGLSDSQTSEVAMLFLIPFLLAWCLPLILLVIVAKLVAEDSTPHGYRFLWFWWRRRPQPTEVMNALKQRAMFSEASLGRWEELSHKLELKRSQSPSAKSLVADLRSKDWTRRLIAEQLLVEAGGRAVDPLLSMLQESNRNMRREAVRLLESIVQQTTAQLHRGNGSWLCPDCLTGLDDHAIRISRWKTTTFTGCRRCGRTRDLINCPHVTAVLDRQMQQPFEQEEDNVKVNSLQRRDLFDFDRIEIVNANDAEVEQFAIDIGNDTDDYRRSRYKDIACHVAPGCNLSENTLRIMRSTFGNVMVS